MATTEGLQAGEGLSTRDGDKVEVVVKQALPGGRSTCRNGRPEDLPEGVEVARPLIDLVVETMFVLGSDIETRPDGLIGLGPPLILVASLEGAPASSGRAWGIDAVGARDSKFTGAGVVPAVLDTGIDRSHPAFQGVELVEKDFSGSGDGDRAGHGTHCAGTVFGRDVDGMRIGVAPGVTKALIGKVFPDQGGATTAMIVQAMQWAIENGAHVVSMSLGWDFPGLVKDLTATGISVEVATSSALEDYRANLRMFDALMRLIAARAAFGGGTVVLAAAGNESGRDRTPPFELAAGVPAAADVLSVGALAPAGDRLAVAPFSNTHPQVSAPGVGITSALVGGGTTAMNGTSMACPHAAGVAALWWEAVRASGLPVTAATVQAKLLASARTDVFAPDVEVADRGVGLVTAP